MNENKMLKSIPPREPIDDAQLRQFIFKQFPFIRNSFQVISVLHSCSKI